MSNLLFADYELSDFTLGNRFTGSFYNYSKHSRASACGGLVGKVV